RYGSPDVFRNNIGTRHHEHRPFHPAIGVKVERSRNGNLTTSDRHTHFTVCVPGNTGVDHADYVGTGSPLRDRDVPSRDGGGELSKRTRREVAVSGYYARLGPDNLGKEVLPDPTAAELAHGSEVFQHDLGDGAGRLRDVDPGER